MTNRVVPQIAAYHLVVAASSNLLVLFDPCSKQCRALVHHSILGTAPETAWILLKRPR